MQVRNGSLEATFQQSMHISKFQHILPLKSLFLIFLSENHTQCNTIGYTIIKMLRYSLKRSPHRAVDCVWMWQKILPQTRVLMWHQRSFSYLRVLQKNLKFCFSYISNQQHRNFTSFVSTPNNKVSIMRVMEKKCEVLILVI